MEEMPAKETDQTQSRERRSLTGVASAGAADVLVQESVAPVVRDDWPDGFDYVCGHCGEMVLASCVADDQLWALGFRCFVCKKVSLSPALPPGMALPRVTVLIPPEMFPAAVTNTIYLRRQTIVGQAALDRRRAEAGPPGTTFGLPHPAPPARGDATFLQGLLDELRRLLGATLNTLDRVDKRRRASGSKNRHPLMVVVQSVRLAIASFATPTPTVDDRWVMELVILLQTLRRWSSHPLWPTFVQGLNNEYLH